MIASVNENDWMLSKVKENELEQLNERLQVLQELKEVIQSK